MQQPLGVEVLQGFSHGQCDPQRHRFVEDLLPGERLLDGHPFDVLHDEKGVTIDLAGVDGRDHIRVREPRGEPGFADEPHAVLGAPRQSGVEDLHRDDPVKARAAGPDTPGPSLPPGAWRESGSRGSKADPAPARAGVDPVGRREAIASIQLPGSGVGRHAVGLCRRAVSVHSLVGLGQKTPERGDQPAQAVPFGANGLELVRRAVSFPARNGRSQYRQLTHRSRYSTRTRRSCPQ